jgi:hypothetical protein
MVPVFRFLALLAFILPLPGIHGVRFEANSPILTITVKDPEDAKSSIKQTTIDDAVEDTTKPWFDLSALRPNIIWGVQSKQPPLPNWLPSLTSLKAGIGYSYNDLKRLPSIFDCTAKFAVTPASEIQFQPSYDLRSRNSNLLVQFSRGAAYLFARLGSKNKYLLEGVQGSILFRLPTATISSVRLTPNIDLQSKRVACAVEAITGGAGRTKVILQLERQNPTLAIIYALDDRNVIAPQISLYDAKIVYQWNVDLGSGSSVRTKVDPASAIHVTWTDRSAVGGSWVTDVRLPLEDRAIDGLSADVRVRRQFSF